MRWTRLFHRQFLRRLVSKFCRADRIKEGRTALPCAPFVNSSLRTSRNRTLLKHPQRGQRMRLTEHPRMLRPSAPIRRIVAGACQRPTGIMPQFEALLATGGANGPASSGRFFRPRADPSWQRKTVRVGRGSRPEASRTKLRRSIRAGWERGRKPRARFYNPGFKAQQHMHKGMICGSRCW